jgi:hypothetical protein
VLDFIQQVWNQRNLEKATQFMPRDLFLHDIGYRTWIRPEGYRRALLKLLRPFPSGQTVRLDRQDMFSVPAGSWRAFQLLTDGQDAATPGTAELLVVNGGDGRVRLEWAPDVIEATFESGWMLDPNGYLAPVAVMISATEDD